MKTAIQRLLAANGPGRPPKIVRNYDPDWDGDDDSSPAFDPDMDGDQATMFFYDIIGGWDQPATEDIVRGIRALKASTIHLRINSPGGLVFESVAIKTALEQHPAQVIAHVDGLAASAASTLMLAADEIEIAPGGFVMIHNAETFAWGNKEIMAQAIAMLEAIDGSIAAQYGARTGLALEDVAAMMAAETWLSAQDALDKKLVDRIATPSRPSNRVSNLISRFDLTAYRNTPAALLKPPGESEALAKARALQAHNERRLRLLALGA